MSYNTQDRMTFVVDIQKRGDTSFLTKFVSDINSALSGATKGVASFTSSTNSQLTTMNSNLQKSATFYNSFGKAIGNAISPVTQFNAAVGKTVGTSSQGHAALTKYGAGFAVLGQNAKSGVSFLTQFDASVRANATSMNTGSVNATRYSAIFKTIPASVQSATAAITANTAAITANTAKQQQYGAIMRTTATGAVAQGAAFKTLNSSLQDNAKSVTDASTAQTRMNQGIIQNARGVSTLVLSFAMLNSAATDYRINQESMADINQKVTDAQERLTAAIEKYGEGSFQAEQATAALEKAERGLRFELREQQNQLNNMLFLYILIGQEIASSAIPAFLNMGKTIDTLRNGFGRFIGVITGGMGAIRQFSDTLVTGSVAGTTFSSRMQQIPTDVDGVTRSIGGMNAIIMDSNGRMINHGNIVNGLGNGYNLYGKAIDDTNTKQSRAGAAAERLRGGLSRISSTLGVGGGAGLIGGMIAAGVGLALYSTNAGGARDMTNAFGQTVGQLHPLLAAAGSALVGIAGAMGLTGESTQQINHHFAEAGESFHDFTTAWHDALETMKNDTNVVVSTIGAALSTLSNNMDTLGKGITGQPLIDVEKVNAGGQAAMDEFNKHYQKGRDNAAGFLGPIGTAMFDTQYGGDEGRKKYYEEVFNPEMERLKTKGKEEAEVRAIDQSKKDVDKMFDYGDPMYKNAIPATVAASGGNVEDYINMLKNESALYKETKEQSDAYTNAILDSTSAKENATIMGEMMRHGMLRYRAEYAEEAMSLKENAAYLDAYAASLDKPTRQQFEMAKGMTAQAEAGLKARSESFQLVGVYEMLNQQVTTGTALEDAYRTGLYETNIALLNRGKEIVQQSGSLDAYNNAIVAGTVQTLAFAEGVNMQREALYQSVEATSTANGQLNELNTQLENNTITAAAFNQGYAETALAIKQTNVEIAQGKGSWNAWVEAAQSGEIASQAFQKGILAQNDALKSSYETLHQSAGALVQFNAQLATGLPQGIAFAQTLTDLGTVAQGMEVELSKSIATLMFNQSKFNVSLNDTRNAMVDLNGVTTPTISNLMKFGATTAKAFTDGRAAAYEWLNGMVESAHATAGLTLETANLATKIPVLGDMIRGGLVPAFNQGAAATQEFIALFLKAPEAIGKVRDELKGIFDGVISGFADAMRKGESEMDDAIKEFSDHLGIEFNKGVTEALEFQAGSELFTDLTKDFGALFIGIGNNLDQESFDHLKDQVQGRLETTMDKVMDDLPDGPLKNSVAASMGNIMKLFENAEVGDMKSPTGITNMIGGIGMELMNLDGLTNNFQTTWDALMAAMMRGDLAEVNRLMKVLNTDMNSLNQIVFDPISGQMVTLQNSIKLTTDEWQAHMDRTDQVREKFVGLQGTVENVSNALASLGDQQGKIINKDAKGNITDVQATPLLNEETDKNGKPKDILSNIKPSTTPWGSGTGSGNAEGIAGVATAAAAADTALKQLEATAKTVSAAVIAQFQSMAMSASKELTVIPLAAVGTFQTIAAAASAQIPIVTSQFTAMGIAASQELGKIPVAAIVTFEQIGVAATGVTPTVTEAFTQMGISASLELGKIPIAAIGTFEQIGVAATGVTPTVTAAFTQMGIAASLELGKIPVAAVGTFSLISTAVAGAIPGVTTEFARITLAATTEFGKIIEAAIRQFTLAGDQARLVTVGVTTHFNDAKSNAQGVLATMKSDASTAFGAIGKSADQVSKGVSTHFSAAATAGKGIMKSLETAVKGNFDAMASAADKVKSAIDKIGTAADTAKGKVNSLKTSVESLPNISRTITYTIKTVGSAPSGAGAGIRAGAQGIPGLVNMAGGGRVNLEDGPNRTIVTGESGSEFVRLFSKKGMMKEEVVDNIKSYNLKPGEAIQVQPLEGHYAQRFLEKFGNIINMASGQNFYYQNNNGVINTNIPGLGPDNTPNVNTPNMGSSTPYSDVTAFPTTGSTIGNPYSDDTDTVFTNDPYNRNLTNSQWGSSYLGGGRWYDPMTNTYGPTPRPDLSGNTPGTGGGGNVPNPPGGGGGGSPYEQPSYVKTSGGSKWTTSPSGALSPTEMTDDDKKGMWKVVDANNKNVAAEFKSKAEAEAWIAWKNGADTGSGTGGGGQIIDNGGIPSSNGQNQTNNQSGPNNNTNVQTDTNSTNSTSVFGNMSTNMFANNPKGPNGGPIIGGIEFPKGFPFHNIPGGVPSGGGGTNTPPITPELGKIWNMDLQAPTMKSSRSAFEYQNDPTGWHNYGLLPDPIFRERSNRGMDPRSGGSTGPGNPNNPNNPGNNPFNLDILDLLRRILQSINLGSKTSVNVNGKNLMEFIQGQIMDGFQNFK